MKEEIQTCEDSGDLEAGIDDIHILYGMMAEGKQYEY